MPRGRPRKEVTNTRERAAAAKRFVEWFYEQPTSTCVVCGLAHNTTECTRAIIRVLKEDRQVEDIENVVE